MSIDNKEKDDFEISEHCKALLPTVDDFDAAKTEVIRLRGVPVFIQITKHKQKYYKCRAVLVFSTHSELIDFAVFARWEFIDNVLRMRAGATFANNPARQAIDNLTGFIDARLDQIERGESTELTKAIEAYKMSLGPQTNPTKKQLADMRKETTRLIDAITAPGITALFGITSNTVNVWKHRGRISAKAAHEMCQHEELKKRGFTRETLRPDVKFWVEDFK